MLKTLKWTRSQTSLLPVYKVYCKTNEKKDWFLIGTTKEDYFHINILPGIQYTFMITAFCNDNALGFQESYPSEEIHFVLPNSVSFMIE